MIRIEDWVVANPVIDPYTPPEFIKPSLNGKVYGHPRFDDGSIVTTSYIVEVNGRFVTTVSGSVYELGEPDAEYLQWCKNHEKDGVYVPTNEVPIRLKE